MQEGIGLFRSCKVTSPRSQLEEYGIGVSGRLDLQKLNTKLLDTCW